MNRRQGWLLMFLGAPSAESGFPTDQLRVMKGVFLVSRNPSHPISDFYSFGAYDYGPFDSAVYRDLDALVERGYVAVRPVGMRRKIFELTESGRREYERALPVLPADQMEVVFSAKQLVTSLGFDDLLRKIYTEYPSFAENSVARVAQTLSLGDHPIDA